MKISRIFTVACMPVSTFKHFVPIKAYLNEFWGWRILKVIISMIFILCVLFLKKNRRAGVQNRTGAHNPPPPPPKQKLLKLKCSLFGRLFWWICRISTRLPPSSPAGRPRLHSPRLLLKVSCWTPKKIPVFWIRIRIGSGFNQVSESGYRRAKMTQVNCNFLF